MTDRKPTNRKLLIEIRDLLRRLLAAQRYGNATAETARRAARRRAGES